jgi:hypothetical protein
VNPGVFLPSLETEQEETYGHPLLIVGQRFENIAELFTGQLQIDVNKFPHWEAARPSLAPFAIGDVLAVRLSEAARLVWGVLVLLDGVCLVLFVRLAIGFGSDFAPDRSAPRPSP